ncbi:MAG: chemotaxis protein CheW [Candidatus Competibacteraceae bacterium]|nr:chemotaxis protein CheW [Candidatus Competibacteraceae bacterium]
MATTTTDLVALGGHGLQRDGNAEGAQYLTFTLAGEEYGIDILKVQEIRGWQPVTTVPNSPAFVKGVMNLRGAIVPVIDLRLRFGLAAIPYTPTTVVIVVTVQGLTGARIIGAVVDGVSDVLTIDATAVQPAPDFGTAVHIEFISGLVTLETGMVMLLDVDRLLSVEEMFALEAPRPVEARRELSPA